MYVNTNVTGVLSYYKDADMYPDIQRATVVYTELVNNSTCDEPCALETNEINRMNFCFHSIIFGRLCYR